MQKYYVKWYEALDETIILLQNALDISYLEAILETLENVNDQKVLVMDGKPDQQTVSQLERLYQKMSDLPDEAKEKRQAVQLVILKGMMESKVQTNHQMTPDSIGTLCAYFIQRIAQPVLKQEKVSMADLSIGTGNLLYTIYHFLMPSFEKHWQLSGADSDELLIAIASASAKFQGIEIDLYYQDALKPLLMSPVDLVVSDLPVGYYTDQQHAQNFDLAFDQSMSYSHFLLIEQHIHYLKESGYGFFLVPAKIFEDDAGRDLLKYLKQETHLLAMIQMPREFFGSEEAVKALMIIQKHGDQSQAPDEIFIGSAPNFKEMEKMNLFLKEVNNWVNHSYLKGEL